MPNETLDELLKRMPDIAAVVNAFDSEAVQQQAFTLLTSGMRDEAVSSGDKTTRRQTTDSNAKAV